MPGRPEGACIQGYGGLPEVGGGEYSRVSGGRYTRGGGYH